jgi:co-chaperonin GroES (HSP10)
MFDMKRIAETQLDDFLRGYDTAEAAAKAYAVSEGRDPEEPQKDGGKIYPLWKGLKPAFDQLFKLKDAGVLNLSGIFPTEYKVLISPEKVDEKIGSIIVPQSKQEHDKYAQIKGRIVAVSPLAFSYATEAEWAAAKAQKPSPGQLVLYGKYAGVHTKGKDGQDYLLVNDKDIAALVEE